MFNSTIHHDSDILKGINDCRPRANSKIDLIRNRTSQLNRYQKVVEISDSISAMNISHTLSPKMAKGVHDARKRLISTSITTSNGKTQR